jgi:hypothetical protein
MTGARIVSVDIMLHNIPGPKRHESHCVVKGIEYEWLYCGDIVVRSPHVAAASAFSCRLRIVHAFNRPVVWPSLIFSFTKQGIR